MMAGRAAGAGQDNAKAAEAGADDFGARPAVAAEMSEHAGAASFLDLPPAHARPRRRWFVLLTVLAVTLLSAGGLGLVELSVSERSRTLRAHWQDRLAALAQGKAEVLETWVDGAASLGSRLVRSDLVRLYLTERGVAADADDNAELTRSLAEQTPYMRQVVNDFASQHDLVGAYLLDSEGELVLADRNAPPLEAGQSQAARRLVEASERRRVRSPRRVDGALVLDILRPIAPPQADPETGASRPAGALIMTVLASARLERLLAPDEADLAGERAHLFLPAGDGVLRLGVDEAGELAVTAMPRDDVPRGANGGLFVWSDGGQARLAVSTDLPLLDAALVLSVAESEALAPLKAFERTATIFALGAGFVLALSAVAVWWWQSSRHHAALAEQYRTLADRIEHHRRLLASITENTEDLIALEDGDGRYRHVNAALARAVAASPERLKGRTARQVLAADTASWLAAGRRDIAVGRPVVRVSDHLAFGHRRGYWHCLQVPVADQAGHPIGVVMVARDITDLVTERLERERLMMQTVEAFVRAVELVDPYLLGHTVRLRQTALAMAEEMGLDREARRTLALAAGLSQIGKIFVPREIVAKPGRHTDAEARIMQGHVGHALKVIESVGLGRDVEETLAQMYERLDGSGYPRGLAGEEIAPLARILAVADVYCARTQPRSYRDRLDSREVLHWLRANGDRYDERAVEALATIIAADNPAATPEPATTEA